MPGIIPIKASSQLVRPSVRNGRATEIPVIAKPSNMPKMPNTSTIFQVISFHSGPDIPADQRTRASLLT
jgi:hypothetical protein